MKVHYKKQKGGACHGKQETGYIGNVTCPNCLRNIALKSRSWLASDQAGTKLRLEHPKAFRSWFG